jgi:hypothetical protein
LQQEVITIALKERMRFDVNMAITIAAGPTIGAGFPLAGNANAVTVIDTGWNLNLNRHFPAGITVAFAITAGVRNHTSSALAGWAACLNSEDTSGLDNLALSTTAGAFLSFRAGLISLPLASFADFAAIKRD